MLNVSFGIQETVQDYEIQPNGVIRPSALFRYFQKVAGADLDACGLSYDTLASNGMAFVLVNINVHFEHTIVVGDTLRIDTYPRSTSGASFIRDFTVYVGDRLAALASSQWVLIDTEKRTILRPSALQSVGTIQPDHMFPFILPSLPLMRTAAPLQRTDVRKVYYSSLDRNQHMNNTFYPDILWDYLPTSCLSGLAGADFAIRYQKEARIGETFTVFTGFPDVSGTFHLLALDSGGDVIFSAAFRK